MQAILYNMNQEESKERSDREDRHTGTQRDIRDIKFQMDKLTGVVGDLVTALKGNEFGTEGMVAQVRAIIDEQTALKKRLDDLELANSKKQMYLIAFVTTVGVVIGTLIKTAIDHIFKK